MHPSTLRDTHKNWQGTREPDRLLNIRILNRVEKLDSTNGCSGRQCEVLTALSDIGYGNGYQNNILAHFNNIIVSSLVYQL